MREFVLQILESEYMKYIIAIIMSIILYFLTQLIKIPYKKLTKKAKTERARRILNVLIVLIPLALGYVAEYLITKFASHEEYNVLWGSVYGAFPIVLYAFTDQFKSKSGQKAVKAIVELNNALNGDVSGNGEIANKVSDIIKDQITDGAAIKEESAVKKFFDEVK